MEKFEKYNKNCEYSYSLGAYPTYELIKNKSNFAVCVLVHSKINLTSEVDKLFKLCEYSNVQIKYDDKAINKISNKENCFVVGVFNKYTSQFKDNKQIVLANPSDAGNIGTIMRTMLGFGYTDLAVVKPCVDIFNPKVVRASMGAIFMLNIKEFDSMNEYLNSNAYKKYLFMLNGKNELGKFETPKQNYALVFGNEAHGLDSNLISAGESVVIKHNKKIDSLNLPISVGMAIYEFAK